MVACGFDDGTDGRRGTKPHLRAAGFEITV